MITQLKEVRFRKRCKIQHLNTKLGKSGSNQEKKYIEKTQLRIEKNVRLTNKLFKQTKSGKEI